MPFLSWFSSVAFSQYCLDKPFLFWRDTSVLFNILLSVVLLGEELYSLCLRVVNRKSVSGIRTLNPICLMYATRSLQSVSTRLLIQNVISLSGIVWFYFVTVSGKQCECLWNSDTLICFTLGLYVELFLWVGKDWVLVLAGRTVNRNGIALLFSIHQSRKPFACFCNCSQCSVHAIQKHRNTVFVSLYCSYCMKYWILWNLIFIRKLI